MRVTINIPEEVASAVRQMSTRSGQTEEQLLVAALRAHFPPFPPELADELHAWSRAAEEDAARLNSNQTL